MSEGHEKRIARGETYELDGDEVRVLGISQNIVEITPDGEVLETETVVSYRVATPGEISASESDRTTVTLEWFAGAVHR